MDEIEIRIVELEPVRVAATLGFGPSPEELAWNQILAWMQAKGLPVDAARFFGFNNPNPSAGSPNYGYEQWVTVAPGVTAGGEVEIKQFEGGLYAVTPCRLSTITETWMKLAAWREASAYPMGNHQWLEECLTPPVEGIGDLEFLLYMPVGRLEDQGRG